MLTLAYRGHRLIGVPAVHNRAVFAEMVNRACADAATRPAAIAVELDPAAAAAVAGWLEALGVAPGEAPLPCMLGLARQNRRIHPRFKAAALRLQQTTGRQLHELAPDLLYRELGYAPVGLLCLSPTDSIIEAIRCALELKAPLYGIDLDDPAAPAERPARHRRDPLAARGDLAAYLRALGRQADQARDEHTDGRRELVMAARLKALLMRHDRVLFTGGLGHWASLCRLLADDGLAPAREVPQDGPVRYQRVLVHPRQALAHMDLFPRLTAAYEAARQPVTRDRARREDLDFQDQFRHCLEAAFRRYAESAGSAESNHGLVGYTQYLLNVCLLAQCLVPDIATALAAARSMMPGAFVQILADTLMDFDWASSARFGDLPIIGPDAATRPRAGQTAARSVMKTPVPESAGDQPEYADSAPFYVAPLHGDQGPGLAECAWRWEEEPTSSTREPWRYGYNFVWPPCENLFYASIYEAINLADGGAKECRTEPFAGTLYDGIELKASLRSVISGKPQLFVKRTLKRPLRRVVGEPVAPSYTPTLELQPTVFIFSHPTEAPDLSWEILNAGTAEIYDDLSERGKRFFRATVTQGENLFIESIHYAEDVPLPPEMPPWVRGLRRLHGSVRFGNPCVNFHQSATWLEKGRFKAAPVLSGPWRIERALALYRQRHHLAIDPRDWRNALILFALPYALTTRRVVVVCPETFRIGTEVRREAQRRKIALFTLPLAHFPAARIEQIRRQYSVMAAQGGKEFPPELELALGQKETAWSDLLPPAIRRQTRPRPEPA